MTANDVHAAIEVVLLVLGLAIVWCLGYIKGRWDAGRSIGRRYNLTPRTLD